MRVHTESYFHIGFTLLLMNECGMTFTIHIIQTFIENSVLFCSKPNFQHPSYVIKIFFLKIRKSWIFIYLVEPTIRMVLVQLRLSLSCLFLSILQNLEKQDEWSKINKNIFATHVTKDKARRDTVGINTLVMIVHRVGLIYMCI